MNPVSNTARWVAAVRAEEAGRPDRLFHDPLARALAGEEGFAMREASLAAGGPQADPGPYIVIRTRFFDDFVAGAAAEGVRQFVTVAAGMDARAFRLPWPDGTTLYEVDRPEVLALKGEILARERVEPACVRVPVGGDLEGEWVAPLQEAGFAPGQRSCWLAEGLTPYLTEAAVRGLLSALSSVATAGSRLGIDFVGASFFSSPFTRDSLKMMAERGMGWHFGTDEPEALLDEYGWRAEAIQPGEEGAHFGRWPYPPLPREQKEFPHSFLVTAIRR